VEVAAAAGVDLEAASAKTALLPWDCRSQTSRACRANLQLYIQCALIQMVILSISDLRRQAMEILPALHEYSAEDKRIAELQTGFATRLRKSPYYITEQAKSTGVLCSFHFTGLI
jgi:hypothetical protein